MHLKAYPIELNTIPRWLLLLITTALLLVSVAGCDNSVSPGNPSASTSTSGVASQATAASWPDQLHAAQSAMAKIDQNATLINILSSPKGSISSSWDYSSTFGVTFTFLSASGSRTGVSLDDTLPATTVSTIDYPKISDAAPQPLTPDEARQALSQVTISPREAGRITWEDPLVQARLHATKVRPLVGIDLSHKPVAWIVTYIPNPDVFTGIQDQVAIYVDAHIGAILQRDSGTPSP
jgi:hypothetical protein